MTAKGKHIGAFPFESDAVDFGRFVVRGIQESPLHAPDRYAVVVDGKPWRTEGGRLKTWGTVSEAAAEAEKHFTIPQPPNFSDPKTTIVVLDDGGTWGLLENVTRFKVTAAQLERLNDGEHVCDVLEAEPFVRDGVINRAASFCGMWKAKH